MKRKLLSLLLALVMVLSLLPTSAFAVVKREQTNDADTASGQEQSSDAVGENGIDLFAKAKAIAANRPQQANGNSATGEGYTVSEISGLDTDLKVLTNAGTEAENTAFTAYAPTDMVRVMVVIEGVSLLDMGYDRSELTSSSARYVAEAMEEMQDALVDEIQSVVDATDFSVGYARTASADTTVETVYHYTTLLNGVSVKMPYGALNAVRALDGVESAFVVPTYSVPEDMTGDTAQPFMYATQQTFGSAETWDAGYTGEGMKIAIIDTGLDADHPSFADAPSGASMTQDDIDAVLTSLNAYETYSTKSSIPLKSRNLYRSEKVAFGFNYVDIDLDITHDKDDMGDHGTHVAGITAANRIDSTDVVGVAPDAQLLIMKVFGKNGGAYWDDIVAALEDSILLDVDAVNMSLGSPAGFDVSDESEDVFNEWANEVYAKVESCDMILAIAAGNSYSAAYGTPLGTNLNLASDPDNSIVSSPATYPSATMVASIENAFTKYNYFLLGDQKIPYTDVAAYGFFSTLGAYGQTEYPYVMIDGYGTADDFAAVGESWENYGKIAVVSRGELAFTDKQTNAASAGFSALIVYNNGEDGLMNMQDAQSIPNIFISKEGGAALAAAADENGEGTITLTSDMTMVASETAGQMSDFSSWGLGADLELQPDVTAPGGNIYSSINDGKYGVMSGTSMATPHIAGMSALVLEYLHKNYTGHGDTWYRTAAEALIMSTAEPVVEPSGALYSPRKQGAGAANVYSAVSSSAYLTVNGGTPKISLGDDDAKLGAYTFSFEINNLSGSALVYRLGGTALTDQVTLIGGEKYMGETSRTLNATFDFSGATVNDDQDALLVAAYDYNGDGIFSMQDVQDFLDDVNHENTIAASGQTKFDFVADSKLNTADVQSLYEMAKLLGGRNGALVTVPAGETVTVTVALTLSDSDRAYMDANYKNGIYVDAFVRCYQVGGAGVDLSLPVAGFYGDWSAAPVFDDSGWDLFNDSPKRYWNVLWTDANYSYNLGANPYITEPRSDAHNVLSPNGDGYQDMIGDLYLGMLRNAKKVNFILKDENGNVVHSTTDSYVRKSYYNSSYDLCIPYIYSNYADDALYDFANAQSGEHYTFTIEAFLDDGDNVADDSVTIPITIDTEAPQIDIANVQYVTENGKRQLVFTVSDNYDIAAVITLTAAGSIIDRIPVNEKIDGVDGESKTITLDVSSYDTDFVLAVCDYGFNESLYSFHFEGEGHNINANAFYGYRNISVVPSGGYNYVTTAYNGWYSFTDASSMLMHTDAYYNGESAVSAADYVDGWIIGIDENGEIFATKAGEWDRNAFGMLSGYPQALDMTYDFKNDVMYVLTDEEEEGLGGYLLTLDILTGEITELGRLSGFANKEIHYDWGYTYVQTYGQALTLACDNDGVLYAVNHADGDLYTVDPATCTATLVGSTGYAPKYYQSMTVDHATNRLYWAAYQSYSGTSCFYEVDKATGAVTDVTSSGIQHNAEMTALFKPNTACGDLVPDDAALSGIKLNASSATIAAGTGIVLTATSEPYYAVLGEVKWTSANSSVATVDATGAVTGVASGETVITASCGGFTASCTVTVVKAEAELVVNDAMSNTWLSLSANAPQNAQTLTEATAPANLSYNYFISAAYAHGSVYAFDYYGGFYKFDAETMQGVRLGGNSKVNGTSGLMLAMAYNYADGYLYGIAQQIEGSFFDAVSTYELVRINLSTGRFTTVGEFDTESYGIPYNMAIDREGNFYSIVDAMDYFTWETTTQIMTYAVDESDCLTCEMGAALVDFVASDYATVSSLVWSEENECLFWADYYGLLERIDPATGDNLVLGTVGSTAYNDSISNTCLFTVVKDEPAAPSGVEIESIAVAPTVNLLDGGSSTVSVTVEPWNAVADLSYEIEDTSIATVDANGVVTGVSAGTTTLTITEKTMPDFSLTADITVKPSTGDVYGMIVDDMNYGSNYWAKISDTDPASGEMIADFSSTFFAPFAGAYYDGYLYAYSHAVDAIMDVDGFDYEYRYYLLRIDPVDYTYEVLGNNRRIHETIMDMTFDYTTGTMYGVAYNAMSGSSLVQIDLETAEVVTVGTTGTLDMRALAADATGQLYAIDVNGDLYRVDKATARVSYVGSTGVSKLNGYQSMTYDYETGNTYWAQYSSDGTNGLLLLDLTTGTTGYLGCIVGAGANVACLYTVSDNDPLAPASVPATGVSLPEKQTVAVGGSIALNASILPISVANVEGALSWSSGNESVAVVDNWGNVTGISAGTAYITASVNGRSASCLVTVTATERSFYAYDESSRAWVSFSADSPYDVTLLRADAEDEEKITASLYHDGKLYSFTADGRFWSLDPNTFERTLISDGFFGAKMEVTEEGWWGPVTSYYDLSVLSMAYDEATGKAYAQLMPWESYYGDYYYHGLTLVEIDLETGALVNAALTDATIWVEDPDTWESVEQEVKLLSGSYVFNVGCQTNALLIRNGIATFVDTFTSGMVIYMDMATGEYMENSLVYNYWGNAENGRGMMEDPLTGTIYIVRDMRDWGGLATLNTITLSDADVTNLGEIGTGESVYNSLFLR